MSPDSITDSVTRILDELARRTGVRFHDHRRETVLRGLYARASAAAVASLEDYLPHLEDDLEAQRLISAIVVPVTSFFRDPAVFEALQTSVLPRLCARIGRPLRAWTIGVATGEEAWSLAMLLDVATEATGGFELLATDVDATCLAAARAGRYPGAAAADVPQALRARYLSAVVDDDVLVAAALRDRVRFAVHDLVGPRLAPREAVVASFDLVVLRNVLIYFDPRLQGIAVRRAASVLPKGGALVLGPVESIPVAAHGDVVPWAGLPHVLRIFERTSR